MGLKFLDKNDLKKEEEEEKDKRNTKKRFLLTDGVCLTCGCINNTVYDKECVVCYCKCGNSEFIYGKISVDLRKLLDFKIDELRDLCEIRELSMGTRAKMTVSLLRDFNYKKGYKFDERVNEFLIRKILKRNKRKFRFTVDIESEIKKVNKKVGRDINLEFLKREDMKE
jgi:hypothetical protein